MYSEKDLVSFGKYLLSKEREESLRQTNIEEPTALPYEERFRDVHDADLANWKTMKLGNNDIDKDLNASESLYGFCAWLTTRDEQTIMSAKDNCSPILELIDKFKKANNLPEVREDWAINLVHPKD